MILAIHDGFAEKISCGFKKGFRGAHCGSIRLFALTSSAEIGDGPT
jgi:hypothetical protein